MPRTLGQLESRLLAYADLQEIQAGSGLLPFLALQLSLHGADGSVRMICVMLDYKTPNMIPLRRRWNLRHTLCLALLPLLVGTLVLLALFFPGVFYRHCDEVNIRSGRIRRSDYVLLLRVNQSTEASPLSTALATTLQHVGQPDWRVVNKFGGTRHVSPHYDFHGAITQIKRIEMLWQLVPFTAEAKQQVAETVLRLWQTGSSDWESEKYIHALEDVASKAEKSGQPVRVGQLPGQVSATQPAGQP